MRASTRFVVAVLALVAVIGGAGSPVEAHAVLIDTEPRSGSILDVSPDRITLTFNEEVGTSFSSIRVLDFEGDELSSSRAERIDSQRVGVEAPQLGDGTYIVIWRVVSADGHPVEGSFTFQIGATSQDVSSVVAKFVEEEHGLSRLFSIIRWVLLAGIIVLIGAVWLITRDPSAKVSLRTRMVVWGGWSFAFLATVQTLFAYGPHASGLKIYEATDLDLLRETLGTAFGQWQLVRVAVLIALAVLLREMQWRDKPAWRVSAALLLVTSVATVSVSGHAITQGSVVVSVALDIVHFSTVGLWLGGLATIAIDRTIWLGDGRTQTIGRFSKMSGVAVPMIVATGFAQSVMILDSPADLFEYRYGRLLALKVAIVVALVLLGVVSRRILRRVGSTKLGPSIAIEAVLGAVIIAVTAVLTGVPPSQASTIEPFAETIVRGDVVADVAISPARVGSTEVHVLFNSPGGALSRIELVAVRASLARRGVPPNEMDLAEVGPNHWTGTFTFAFAGEWRLDVVAEPDPGRTVLYRFVVPIAE
jgi:copper transport protein